MDSNNSDDQSSNFGQEEVNNLSSQSDQHEINSDEEYVSSTSENHSEASSTAEATRFNNEMSHYDDVFIEREKGLSPDEYESSSSSSSSSEASDVIKFEINVNYQEKTTKNLYEDIDSEHVEILNTVANVANDSSFCNSQMLFTQESNNAEETNSENNLLFDIETTQEERKSFTVHSNNQTNVNKVETKSNSQTTVNKNQHLITKPTESKEQLLPCNQIDTLQDNRDTQNNNSNSDQQKHESSDDRNMRDENESKIDSSQKSNDSSIIVLESQLKKASSNNKTPDGSEQSMSISTTNKTSVKTYSDTKIIQKIKCTKSLSGMKKTVKKKERKRKPKDNKTLSQCGFKRMVSSDII